MTDASGEGEVLDLRTFNRPLALYSLVFFGMATVFWISHEFGRTRGGPLVFACLFCAAA